MKPCFFFLNGDCLLLYIQNLFLIVIGQQPTDNSQYPKRSSCATPSARFNILPSRLVYVEESHKFTVQIF